MSGSTIHHALLRSVVLAAALATAVSGANAADTLIRNATVHTIDAAGVLQGSDVLIRDGRIAAIGRGLPGDGARPIDAGGRPLTPGFFAGLTGLGIEEVSGEATTVDDGITFTGHPPGGATEWRPEFDVTPAFNPRSSVIGVNRVEGLTWTVLAPSAKSSFVGGQGTAVRLDGGFDAVLEGSRSLFVDLGSRATGMSGGSRAAQYMLLEQAAVEARASNDPPHALLTLAGRAAMKRYLDGGRVVFRVDRASDILQALDFAQRHGMRAVIAGGTEAWQVADRLAAARVPVLLDALSNLPGDFDRLGATLENAARLHAAGVTIAFSQGGDASHNARKVRQLAGNAVAHGLPWDAALAAITRAPAEIFGQADRGRIAVGQRADLVLWSGDPLEVTSAAEAVWIDGAAQPMRSRQTELRDRYLAR
jgi:hypothetical protein